MSRIAALAAALPDRQVRAASADPAPVRVSVSGWSGRDQQDDITGWVRLEGSAGMDALAARPDGHRRSDDVFPTAIGAAPGHALDRFASLPGSCGRRVVDISGVGASNAGPPPRVLWGDPRPGMSIPAVPAVGPGLAGGRLSAPDGAMASIRDICTFRAILSARSIAPAAARRTA